jgi:hypothetical protein
MAHVAIADLYNTVDETTSSVKKSDLGTKFPLGSRLSWYLKWQL